VSWPGPREAYLDRKQLLDDAIAGALASGMYILGPEVEAFEQEFAAFVGTEDAVGVASGTDALVVALRAVGIGPGDRVATVSHTAVATVAAIEMTGAAAVLVDIDPASMTMDPASLARTVDAVGGVAAVVPVHLYGHPADLTRIGDWAAGQDVAVVEDCSQAHGASWLGRQVGTWGSAAAYSCYPTKNLGALGDAGVLTSSRAIADQARLIRQYGWQERYISAIPGINSRLDPVQAAVLRVRLAHLAQDNAARRQVAAWYGEHLPTGVTRPAVAREAVHVYHQYVVQVSRRDQHLAAMRSDGVPVALLYPQPVHTQPAYQGRVAIDPAGLPVTEQVRDALLCLPMHPLMTEQHVLEACASLARSMGA
jgi:dTDP-4-amino-4,6-dideoxygalactose transaminase